MPKYRIEDITKNAPKYFVDRDEYIKLFNNAHLTLTQDIHLVLGFYGFGGIGKSSPVSELCKRLQV